MEYNRSIEIAKKLISIPSYLSDDTNEEKIGDYIYEQLNKLKYLKIEKQIVSKNRFNIIAHCGEIPKLMFCCHMDTVMPSQKWSFDPLTPKIIDNKIYGLGASDMKGGIASLLSALEKINSADGLYLLFDVDEEYYFEGINKFLESYKPTPELIILLEPGLEIKNGHRGVIEVYFKVRGVTGHAARPEIGKNAITESMKIIYELQNLVDRYIHKDLGRSTMNVAYMHGGVSSKNKLGEDIIIERGNKIPDIVEIVIDIRPTAKNLNGDTIKNTISNAAIKAGLVIDNLQIKIDNAPFFIEKKRLSTFERIVKKSGHTLEYADISKYGYGEGQLLNEKLGVDCIYFGPGPDSSAHINDEFAYINEIEIVENIIIDTIKGYCN